MSSYLPFFFRVELVEIASGDERSAEVVGDAMVPIFSTTRGSLHHGLTQSSLDGQIVEETKSVGCWRLRELREDLDISSSVGKTGVKAVGKHEHTNHS